jgi:hypothetical protein
MLVAQHFMWSGVQEVSRTLQHRSLPVLPALQSLPSHIYPCGRLHTASSPFSSHPHKPRRDCSDSYTYCLTAVTVQFIVIMAPLWVALFFNYPAFPFISMFHHILGAYQCIYASAFSTLARLFRANNYNNSFVVEQTLSHRRLGLTPMRLIFNHLNSFVDIFNHFIYFLFISYCTSVSSILLSDLLLTGSLVTSLLTFWQFISYCTSVSSILLGSLLLWGYFITSLLTSLAVHLLLYVG